MIYLIDHEDSFTYNLAHLLDSIEPTFVSNYYDINLGKLESARHQDPCELITKPTLSRYPIKPNTKQIFLLKNTENQSKRILSIPIHHNLTKYV